MTKKSAGIRVLAVDDDPKVFEALRLALEPRFALSHAPGGREALEMLSKKSFELIFLDVRMDGLDGLETLRRIKDSGEEAPVIMLSAANAVRTAVQAMRLGAFDYIPKPFDPEEIATVAEKALELRSLRVEVAGLQAERIPVHFENIIGQSKAMKDICGLIAKVAPTEATVLIQGESGTGKELVARALHFAGPRAVKPFVAVNCAGIPESLIETELFGHERGAFTGAERQKPGKFELAHGGTLFLDEVSSLRLDLQGKILRALQEREIERVGGTKTVPVDLRVVAATNIDLKKAVREGRFRDDLYYRLCVIPVTLPPLRERREDVPLLARYFLDKNNRRLHKKIRGMTEKALGYLSDYPWPGNVRELENMMERLSVLSDKDVIDAQDLPFDVFLRASERMEAMMAESLILKDAREDFERRFIRAALEKTGWNRGEAARMLGIHRNTLLLKTDELGVKETRDG